MIFGIMRFVAVADEIQSAAFDFENELGTVINTEATLELVLLQDCLDLWFNASFGFFADVSHFHLHLEATVACPIFISQIKNRVKHIFIHLLYCPFILKFTDAIGIH